MIMLLYSSWTRREYWCPCNSNARYTRVWCCVVRTKLLSGVIVGFALGHLLHIPKEQIFHTPRPPCLTNALSN